MERREFIAKSCQVCAGLTGMSVLMSSCSSVYFAKTQMVKDQIVVPKSEFSYKKKEEIKTRTYVFVKSDNQKYPICLYKIHDNYVAYWTECTHQGCEIEVQGSRFVCPCHGSTFNLQGQVIKGPAEKNLKSFKTSTDDENIYIILS